MDDSALAILYELRDWHEHTWPELKEAVIKKTGLREEVIARALWYLIGRGAVQYTEHNRIVRTINNEY